MNRLEKDFYDLSKPERIEMIGSFFSYNNPIYKNKILFVLGLHENQFNYGIQQGLICISPIRKSNYKKQFYMSAESPDDLDITLIFNEKETYLRQEIIAFLRKTKYKDVFYKEFFKNIQKQFNAGTIWI